MRELNRLTESLYSNRLDVMGLKVFDKVKEKVKGYWKEAREPTIINAGLGYGISGGYALASGLPLIAATPLILGSTILGALAYSVYRLGKYLYNKMDQPAQPRAKLAYGY